MGAEMTVRKPYVVKHQTIEGLLEDRDTGWPELELEMHPLGTERPKEEQGKELVLKIGKASTHINEEGIAALRAFLDD